MRLYFKFAVYRTISIFCIQTYYVPDEYWQTLEIAHSNAFGYGYKTWEYREGLRSYLYPSIFNVLFNLLKNANLDTTALLVVLPRLLQALITAASDVTFISLTNGFNINIRLGCVAVLTNWYTFYSGSRTLINTFEYNLVIFGLHYFPLFHTKKKTAPDFTNFSLIVCASCFIRPTAIIIWAPFCLYWGLTVAWHTRKLMLIHFTKACFLCAPILISIDSYMYGKLTITPWQFLKFNVISGFSNFYGTHPFWWYFIQGIPVVLGVLVIPFVLTFFRSMKDMSFCGGVSKPKDDGLFSMLFTISCSLTVYSAIPHKEFRFIHPIVPFMTIVALRALQPIRSTNWKKCYYSVMVIGFILPTTFFGLIHQRGALTVMNTLASEAAHRPNEASFLFLMPCHSTPLYSHIHVKIPVRFITCEPPLTNKTVDESEEFFSSPLSWLNTHWTKFENAPSHIVLFDTLAFSLEEYLLHKKFNKLEVIYHTLLPTGRVSGNIVIYRSTNWSD